MLGGWFYPCVCVGGLLGGWSYPPPTQGWKTAPACIAAMRHGAGRPRRFEIFGSGCVGVSPWRYVSVSINFFCSARLLLSVFFVLRFFGMVPASLRVAGHARCWFLLRCPLVPPARSPVGFFGFRVSVLAGSASLRVWFCRRVGVSRLLRRFSARGFGSCVFCGLAGLLQMVLSAHLA